LLLVALNLEIHACLVQHCALLATYGTTGGSIEVQLRLAKAKITNAQANGAYGSGTPMLGSDLSETEIDIIALVAVFGAISAAS
jgi:hypothetical protein